MFYMSTEIERNNNTSRSDMATTISRFSDMSKNIDQ